MIQFANVFLEQAIVVTLSRQLSWSHFVALLPIKNKEKRLHLPLLRAREIIASNRLH